MIQKLHPIGTPLGSVWVVWRHLNKNMSTPQQHTENKGKQSCEQLRQNVRKGVWAPRKEALLLFNTYYLLHDQKHSI